MATDSGSGAPIDPISDGSGTAGSSSGSITGDMVREYHKNLTGQDLDAGSAQEWANNWGSDWSGLVSNLQSQWSNKQPQDSSTQQPTWQGLQQSTFGSMPGVPDAPAFDYAQFQAPEPFSYDPFSAPTADSIMSSDPGYQFRLDQGTGALQASAAARGVLNTGGTLKDLVDYGQNAASQEYQGGYNRALGTYQTNRNNAFGNYDENYRNSLNSYITNFGNALTKYNTNYNTQYQTPYNQLFQQYQQGVQNQGQLFNQQFQTATA